MKKKKILILCLLFIIIVIGKSFKEVITEYVPNMNEYNEIKYNCPGKSEVCLKFKNSQELEKYLKEENPQRKFDAITLSTYVVETSSSFGILVFLSPLIMILLAVFKIHSDINSGFIKNILTREKYSSLIKKYVFIASKIALIIPFIYILIFLLSLFLTGFNISSISENMVLRPEYDTFKYNQFFLYGLILIGIQYILHFSYALIGIFVSFINKNKILCIIFGYIYFIILCLVYLIVGAFIFRDIIGFNYGDINYFNLIGNYWFFNDLSIIWVLFLVVLSVVAVNYFILYLTVGKKEKAISMYEKQNS